jgi:hypothetical protein
LTYEHHITFIRILLGNHVANHALVNVILNKLITASNMFVAMYLTSIIPANIVTNDEMSRGRC